MKTFKCIVCKSPLTKDQYEAALGILQEKERILKDLAKEKTDLQAKLREAHQREKQAKEEGVLAERKRNERLLAGRDAEIQRLRERMRQIQRGTTPQSEGLEFEDRLFLKLQREFPEDEIEHTGKCGDVVHFVKLSNKPAGAIVYECKRCAVIEPAHMRQIIKAKKQRDADFAVLVTTGRRFTNERNKKFTGFVLREGILVVSPVAVIALAALLRTHTIEMTRAKIGKDKRAVIANRLMELIASPQFKNQIDGIIRSCGELEIMIKEEAKEHFKIWRKRWNYYQTIHWDMTQIQNNLNLVLDGQEWKSLKRPKDAPLQLAVMSDE
ncbi:MAG TPA: DUF2130 domain-containing protein [Pyrinomonadaceae bacterium]|nr:DUF2130 domain-containing protein [Pyrinomonadaceae bacterium]